MAPRASGHTPVSARARVDLPAALGPTTASTVPAASSKLMPLRVKVCVPGTATEMFSTLRDETGGGSARGLMELGSCSKTASSLSRALRAAVRPRQLPIATSIGASAREAAIEQAMMAPAVISPLIVRYAPTPSSPDWSISRNTRDTVEKPPVISLSRSLALMCSALAVSSRLVKRWPKPMA